MDGKIRLKRSAITAELLAEGQIPGMVMSDTTTLGEITDLPGLPKPRPAPPGPGITTTGTAAVGADGSPLLLPSGGPPPAGPVVIDAGTIDVTESAGDGGADTLTGPGPVKAAADVPRAAPMAKKAGPPPKLGQLPDDVDAKDAGAATGDVKENLGTVPTAKGAGTGAAGGDDKPKPRVRPRPRNKG